MITRWIWVTFQKVGYHRYPDAGTDHNLADVQYLANKHRHLFKFKISIETWHDNRELEFHQFLNYCESLFESKIIDIDFKSVEMLAVDLHGQISKKYPGRDMIIEISEDGECGCTMEFPKC